MVGIDVGTQGSGLPMSTRSWNCTAGLSRWHGDRNGGQVASCLRNDVPVLLQLKSWFSNVS